VTRPAIAAPGDDDEAAPSAKATCFWILGMHRLLRNQHAQVVR